MDATIESRPLERADGSSRVRPAARKWPWTSASVVAVMLFAIGGFLNGTVQRDVPSPATDAEQTVYDVGGSALRAAVIAIPIVGILVAVGSRGPRWGRLGRGLAVMVILALVGYLAMMAASWVGGERFLFAFTS